MRQFFKKFLRKISADKYFTVLTGSMLLYAFWLPLFFYLNSPDLLVSIIADIAVIAGHLYLLVFYKKIRKLVSLTAFILGTTAFCVVQAASTRLVCGMENVIIACIPGIFLLSKDLKPSKPYLTLISSILVLAIAYVTFIKISVLPPQNIENLQRLKFYASSQVFYNTAILALLVYGCLATDIAMRRFKSKRVFLQKKMIYLAKHDPLTGLMNRRRTLEVFDEIRAEKEASGTDFAIAIFDIDNFKGINDNFGHDAGDEILKQYSKTVWDRFK